jgi:hypothetical protein
MFSLSELVLFTIISRVLRRVDRLSWLVWHPIAWSWISNLTCYTYVVKWWTSLEVFFELFTNLTRLSTPKRQFIKGWCRRKRDLKIFWSSHVCETAPVRSSMLVASLVLKKASWIGKILFYNVKIFILSLLLFFLYHSFSCTFSLPYWFQLD